MTIEFYEESGSRSATVKRLGTKEKSTCDVKFRCTGTYDDADVHNTAATYFSTNRIYDILGVSFLVQSYEISHLGGDAWDVSAHYESEGKDDPDEPDPLKRSRQFDTTGGTAHVTAGFAERRSSGSAPDMKGAVDFDGENVNGVDIIVPALQWAETYDVPNGVVTSAWIRGIAGITGCINESSFRGFEAEEVLFAGCSGSQQWDEEKGDGPWSLTFKFIASKNVSNLPIGGLTVDKKGHDYLWIKFEADVEGSNLVKRPQYLYATQVYRKAQFSAIGIGS
jgi:hypothetical protein